MSNMVSEPRGTTPGLCRMEGDYSPAPQTQQAHYVTQLTLCRFLMRNWRSSRTGCPVSAWEPAASLINPMSISVEGGKRADGVESGNALVFPKSLACFDLRREYRLDAGRTIAPEARQHRPSRGPVHRLGPALTTGSFVWAM